MSYSPHDERNPFNPPRAGIGERFSDHGGSYSDAGVIRRANLSHEASVRSLGSLFYLFAGFCGLGTLLFFGGAGGLVDVNNNRGMSPEEARNLNAGLGVMALFGLVLYAGMGYGLRGLQGWARWLVMILTGLALVLDLLRLLIAAATVPEAAGRLAGASLIPLIIWAYIFHLVASAKGRLVFSSGYKEIIRDTPSIQHKTSPIVKVLLGFLIVLVGMAVLTAFIAPMLRK